MVPRTGEGDQRSTVEGKNDSRYHPSAQAATIAPETCRPSHSFPYRAPIFARSITLAALQELSTLTVHPLGEAVALGPWTITVAEVRSGADAQAQLTETNGNNPEAGSGLAWVTARISVQNIGSTRRAIQMSDFAMTGTDGVFRRTGPIVPPSPMLTYLVEPGETVEGWIAAEVDAPESAVLWFDASQLGGSWADGLFELAAGAILPPVDKLDAADTDAGSDPGSPVAIGDTVQVGGWEITVDQVLYGLDMWDTLYIGTKYLEQSSTWITGGAAIHAVVRNLNPFPAFFSSIAFEVADWSGEPWDQMPTLTVNDDVSREYLPGASGEGWAAFGGLSWTEYNLLRVAPFKVGGQTRYYTFSDAPPAGSTTSEQTDPTPAAELDVAVGDTVETTEDLVNLRAEPSTSGSPVKELTQGTQLEVTGEPVTADGYTWLPVTVIESGETGYVVTNFVALVDE